MTDLSLDHSDLVAELLKELSNHNERVEERKIALYELMKLTQEESFSVWDEHFKTILLLLLETLGDKEVSKISFLIELVGSQFFTHLRCVMVSTRDVKLNCAI